MKTFLLIRIVFSGLLFNSLFANGAEFFITDDNSFMWYSPEGKNSLTPAQLEVIKVRDDSRPAEQDLAGNWGMETEGFQVSVRFKTNTFTVGDSVVATILMRNVSDETLHYSGFNRYAEFDIVVANSKNQLMVKPPVVDIAESDGSAYEVKVRPGTQQRYDVPLEMKYLLGADEYLIYVKRNVPKRDQSGRQEIRSGNALIRITAPPPGTPRLKVPDTFAELEGTSAIPPEYERVYLTNWVEAKATGILRGRQTNGQAEKANHGESVVSPQKMPSPLVAAAGLNKTESSSSGTRDLFYGVILFALITLVATVIYRARSRQEHS